MATQRSPEQTSSRIPADGQFRRPAIEITLRRMDDSQSGRSLTREQLRLVLFPNLPAEEGRRRIETALARAEDEERAERVERLADDPDLDAELMRSLRPFLVDDLP